MKIAIFVVLVLIIIAASFYTGLLVARYFLTKSFKKMLDDRIRWLKSSIRNYEANETLSNVKELTMETKNLIRVEGLHCGLDILTGLRNKVELDGEDEK